MNTHPGFWHSPPGQALHRLLWVAFGFAVLGMLTIAGIVVVRRESLEAQRLHEVNERSLQRVIAKSGELTTESRQMAEQMRSNDELMKLALERVTKLAKFVEVVEQERAQLSQEDPEARAVFERLRQRVRERVGEEGP